jgi:pyruvate dehydrogenase E2 component (dihydrolipoamide acetyltransferase)
MNEETGDGTFYLPDLGEGLSEAEIVRWHVTPGDRVVADQPLVTVETDKAVVDIPSPRNGVVEACLGQPGDVIQVGQPLLRFTGDNERVDAGALVGKLPSAPSAASRKDPVPAAAPAKGAGVRASPRARQRARELGVSLEAIVGTGPDGVIQVGDVQSASPGSGEPGSGEPLSGVRRAMARRMADAHASVVRATVTGEADISAWPAAGSPMPRLLRAIGAAAAVTPRLNAWFNDRAETLTLQSRANVGIAMETSDGLFVPVLEDVAAKSLDDLAAGLARLEDEVQHRTINPEALKGQTISLSNFGAVAGLHAEMVVVPPQVAIVGAGRVFERVVLREGAPALARVLPLSISFDHRVITGVEACTFLAALSADLAHEQ